MAIEDEPNPIHTAIIGGGITGVILALALEKRGVSYTVYERAPAFAEIGSGIGISPNAERALAVIDPVVHGVYKQVAASSMAEESYFQWVDGYETNEVIARLLIGVDAFQGGRRCDILEAWARLVPERKVRFGKEIQSLMRKDDDGGGVVLRFRDGSEDEADVVIGCDGIRSRVRELLFGEDNPISRPRYTHKYCFRALLPMAHALPVLGPERAFRRFMYNGPGAHIITYPVAKDALLNALFVCSDRNQWCLDRHTAPGTKHDVIAEYADWHPVIRGLADLLPEKMDKWAIFDMFDHPAPCFHVGAVALAGDAAHAAGPHLGSGAGFGIEDALVLATVLKAADEDVKMGKKEVCCAALAAYNAMRFERDQWLPGATREAVAMFHWEDGEVGRDHGMFLEEISRLFHRIWDYDVEEMVRRALVEFGKWRGEVTA